MHRQESHLLCTGDQIKIKYYMDRWITPPKRVISPTWGPPPPCKQALIVLHTNVFAGQGPTFLTIKPIKIYIDYE